MSHVGPSTQGGPEDAVVQTRMLRFVFTSDATDRFTVDTPHIALCLGSTQTSLGTCGSYLRVFHREGRIFVKFLLEPLLLVSFVSPPSLNALLFNPVVSGSHVLHTWAHGGTGERDRARAPRPSVSGARLYSVSVSGRPDGEQRMQLGQEALWLSRAPHRGFCQAAGWPTLRAGGSCGDGSPGFQGSPRTRGEDGVFWQSCRPRLGAGLALHSRGHLRARSVIIKPSPAASSLPSEELPHTRRCN